MFGKDSDALVSIIIPIYNAEDYLQESLRSVLDQSYKNLEIICVDDGSTDGTPSLLQEFGRSDPRIKVITVDNGGAGVARNLGMEEAKGDYIYFFDADDVLKKNMIRTLVNASVKHDTDIVLFGYYKFDGNNKIHVDYSPKTLKVPLKKVVAPKDMADRLFQADHGMPWNKFYKSEFLRSTGIRFQALNNTNDEFFSRLTTVLAKRMLFLNKVLVGYRVGNKRSLHENANRNILDCTRALMAVHDELKARGYFDMYLATYRKLCRYVLELKLSAADDPDAYNTLKKEISENTLKYCELGEMNFDDEKWDTVIEAGRKTFSPDLLNIYEYRDLIRIFVKRDIATTYKQTILGPLWYIAQPIFTTIMFIMVFGHVASLGTDDIPPVLFYSAGTILWTFFSSLLTSQARVFYSNKEIFGKVYFPRLTVPVSIIIGETIKFLIQFSVFAVIYIVYLFNGYADCLSLRLLLLPVVILWMILMATGLGLIISSITTRYRDLAMALAFFLSMFMYATPVVYPLSEVSGRLKEIISLNPITAVLECFRYAAFGTGELSVRMILCSEVLTFLFLFGGLILFNKNEKTFVDVI